MIGLGNSVFSGSGRVLTGTDVSGGKKLPGATFIHNGVVTCADAVELSHKDTSGRSMLAVVSGSDVHDGVVRMWVSDEGEEQNEDFVLKTRNSVSKTKNSVLKMMDLSGSSANNGVTTEDKPQTFRRVGMPGIGEHRSGGVTSLCMWPQSHQGGATVGNVLKPGSFRYYRLVVMRNERQMKDVRVRVGENIETRLPTLGVSNFKIMCSTKPSSSSSSVSADSVKANENENEELIPGAAEGTGTGLGTGIGKIVIAPTSAMNISYAKPYVVDLNADKQSVDWSLQSEDPEADRLNSFIRCATGVLELFFEHPIAADSYSWEPPVVSKHDGGVETPERWQLFASHDWVSWECVDDCSEIDSGSTPEDLPETGGVSRSIKRNKDASVSQAPSATPDLRHVPMVVSTGEQAVRVWSVCADFAATDPKKRGSKGVSLSMMRGHTDQVTCCTVARGSGLVVSGSLDCTVRIWRPHGGKCLDVLRASSPILCVTTFNSPSSMHLQDERILLRKGAPVHETMRYTIRQVNDASAVQGGNVLLSSGTDHSDHNAAFPIPSFGESGEDSFEAYAWRLEASENPDQPNCLYIQCERDDQTWYLGHDDGEVVLTAAEYRSAWQIDWMNESKARTANPKNSIGRGRGGEALLKLTNFYRITSKCTVFLNAAESGDGLELGVGTVIQIVDSPVRPLRDSDSLWQQVVVVGEESDHSFMHGKKSAGWLKVAYQTNHLVDGVMEPLPKSVAMGTLRCCSVPAGQPACLVLGHDSHKMSASTGMMNASAATNTTASGAGGKEEDPIVWRFAHSGQQFKFEEAMPETTVVAGCEDGSAKIWSNTAVGGWWSEKKTATPVQHTGAIQQVHMVATSDFEASSEGMLLITCSKETDDETDQTVGVWRIDAGVWSCVCRLHPVVVQDYIAGMVKYVDPGNISQFKLTYADPNVTSLTANDLLRIRGQYQSLFEKLVKSLLLVPAQESVADRSQSRELDPDTSFKRERKDDVNFEDGDCYYWIQSSDSINGHGPTFVMDQPLAIEDCKVGMVIREKDTPSDVTTQTKQTILPYHQHQLNGLF